MAQFKARLRGGNRDWAPMGAIGNCKPIKKNRAGKSAVVIAQSSEDVIAE
ncbi:MAG: hypothetical protein HYV68_01100 [Candidatus Taylorbacteria bacterium]|nr:hypothetical protein [Candidatus Taylorbacteria bacterium]